jgi:hypothetical protein
MAVIDGCLNSEGKVVFEQIDCVYIGCLVAEGIHAGQIAVTIQTPVCNDTYYACYDTVTGRFELSVPDTCCDTPDPCFTEEFFRSKRPRALKINITLGDHSCWNPIPDSYGQYPACGMQDRIDGCHGISETAGEEVSSGILDISSCIDPDNPYDMASGFPCTYIGMLGHGNHSKNYYSGLDCDAPHDAELYQGVQLGSFNTGYCMESWPAGTVHEGLYEVVDRCYIAYWGVVGYNYGFGLCDLAITSMVKIYREGNLRTDYLANGWHSCKNVFHHTVTGAEAVAAGASSFLEYYATPRETNGTGMYGTTASLSIASDIDCTQFRDGDCPC